MICGGAGCGKTLLAMEFLVRGAVEFDKPGVFIASEEQSKEWAQNVASLGVDLPSLEAQGKLALDDIHLERNESEITGEYDLEGLFLRLGCAIDSIGARRVVLDTKDERFDRIALWHARGETATLSWDNLRDIDALVLPAGTPVITCENETPFTPRCDCIPAR